jgi:hypothetical protein
MMFVSRRHKCPFKMSPSLFPNDPKYSPLTKCKSTSSTTPIGQHATRPTTTTHAALIAIDPGGFIAPRTATPTATTTTRGRAFSVIGIEAPSLGTNSNRHTLKNATLIMAGRVFAIVDREVAADQVSTHGSVLVGQDFALIGGIGMIFAVVDPHYTLNPGPRCV